MQFYLLLLVAAVVVGGTPLGVRLTQRPWLLFVVCAACGAMFYSYRMLQ